MTTPVSPRLRLLEDQTDLPNISKYDVTVVKLGVVTAARVILRLWKSTSSPDIKKWMDCMLEIVSYVHILADEGEN